MRQKKKYLVGYEQVMVYKILKELNKIIVVTGLGWSRMGGSQRKGVF